MAPETLSAVDLDDDTAGPHRDPPFNPFRTPRTDRARALVADVLGQLGAYEEYRGLRQRKRQRAAQVNYERAVAAVVCDVLRLHLTQPGEWVAQPLSNRYVRKSRYRSPILGNQFSALLDRMTVAEMDFIEVRKGCINPFLPWNTATTIRASKRLIARAEEFDIGIDDFGLDPSEETIVLKHPKAIGAKLRDDRQEYEDTDTTRRYRKEMVRINSWLDNAAIDCWYAEDAGVNVYDRRLRRIFNERFDRGGRLFGGFWMNMKKHHREGLSLDGDSIAVPDYSQMIATTLYALAGHPRPEQDAYKIPGYEFHREGMKKLFASMVHSSHELKRFPEDLPETLTRQGSFAEVSAAVLEAHAPIRDFFYCGAGMEAMFYESEVLVNVLLRLIDREITALPIHDAVIVPKRHLKTTIATMRDAFMERFGFYPMVSVG